MRNYSKNAISCLLCTLLMLSNISCSNANPESTDETSAADTQQENVSSDIITEEETETTAADVITARYTGEDLGGIDHRILAPETGGHFYNQISSNTNEIYYSEQTGELMNDAIYARNLQTEDLLNIRVVPVWAVGDTSGITSMIQTAVTAGTDDFDIALNRMDFLGTSMNSGCLFNLRNISTIDTQNPWWDKNIVDSFTLFGNKLYFISGDINFLDDYAVEVVYFNMEICDSNGLKYPYQSVIEGTWTIDMMNEMGKTASLDMNGDGKLDTSNDIVGHIEQNDHVKHWIYALGEKSIDIADDGTLELMILNERQINVIDKLYALMVEDEMTYTGDGKTFIEGHALFYGNMLGSLNEFRDMSAPFGVVPMPKYDEAQERYGEYISNGWTTAYGIPITNQNPERTGKIFEVLCGYSTDTVRKALYDVLFTAKLVRDEETVRMLDIIFDSKSYDWAVDFTWGGNFANIYNSVYNNKSNNYVSSAQKNLKAITKSLERLVTTIQGFDY